MYSVFRGPVMRFVLIKTKFGIWCFNDNEKEFSLRTTEQLGVILRSVVQEKSLGNWAERIAITLTIKSNLPRRPYNRTVSRPPALYINAGPMGTLAVL